MNECHNLNNLNDFEADGKIIDRICDPPGQKSVYISPGDTTKEVYRLTTFLKFPPQVPVNPQILAAVGFFYTGYKDRVKCFSCGLSVENWMVGDDVQESRWHKENCAMISSDQSGNVRISSDGLFSRFNNGFNHHHFPIKSNTSNKQIKLKEVDKIVTSKRTEATSINVKKNSSNIDTLKAPSPLLKTNYKPVALASIVSGYHEEFLKSLDLRMESDRLKTFSDWPAGRTVFSPKDLARSGFFYLGKSDCVQCFSCGGTLRSWNYNDNVDGEHKRHYPNCKMVLNIDNHNVPLSSKAATKPVQNTSNPSGNNFVELINEFPCLYPINPHMMEEFSRKDTFDIRWPINKVRATPETIARAGFFFLGERDRVKCWYCNGGLQNWDYNDDPWTEHAKWFPKCEFLLQKKGPEFVSGVVSLFPNLRRPVLRNGYDVSPSRSPNTSYSPLNVIDPKVELEKERKSLDVHMNSELAKLAIEMGFSQSAVRNTIQKKLQINQGMYQTLASLVEDLIANSDASSDDNDDDANDAFNISTTTTTTSGIEGTEEPFSYQDDLLPSTSKSSQRSARSLEERMKELEDERQCKICLDQVAEVVFVPCGHLCSCMRCAQALRKCPICRVQICKAIRTYLS